MEENRNIDFMPDDEPAAADLPAEPEVPAESDIPFEPEALADPAFPAVSDDPAEPEESAEPEEPVQVPQRKKPATKPDVKSIDFKKPPIAVIGAVAAAVILILVLLLFGGSPKRTATKYLKANMYGDVVTMHKYMAYDSYAFMLRDEDEEDYFEDLSDTYREDITSWKDLAKYNKEVSEEDFLDEYGDYKVEMEVTKVKDLSERAIEREFEYLMDNLEDYTDFDRDDISAGKSVTIKLKIKGDDGTERWTITVYMVKMGLSWKVLSMMYD